MIGLGWYWAVARNGPACAIADIDSSNARRLARVLRIRAGVCLG